MAWAISFAPAVSPSRAHPVARFCVPGTARRLESQRPGCRFQQRRVRCADRSCWPRKIPERPTSRSEKWVSPFGLGKSGCPPLAASLFGRAQKQGPEIAPGALDTLSVWSVSLWADGFNPTAHPHSPRSSFEQVDQVERQSEIPPLKRQLDFMPQHVFPHATNDILYFYTVIRYAVGNPGARFYDRSANDILYFYTRVGVCRLDEIRCQECSEQHCVGGDGFGGFHGFQPLIECVLLLRCVSRSPRECKRRPQPDTLSDIFSRNENSSPSGSYRRGRRREGQKGTPKGRRKGRRRHPHSDRRRGRRTGEGDTHIPDHGLESEQKGTPTFLAEGDTHIPDHGLGPSWQRERQFILICRYALGFVPFVPRSFRARC